MLSIIIVNFNTKKLTLSCIASIRKYYPKETYEIIVIDNGSYDGSVAAIRKLTNNEKVKIIVNKTNLGFAKANNQGISEAKGEYILLLNSDTQVKKDSINNLLDFAKSDKSIGVVVPRLLNSDGSLQGSVFRLPTVFRTIRQYFFGEKGLLDKYAPPGNNPTVVESTTMAAFLITPSARKKVGMLNEKYFMYFEDLDYCRRVKNAGLKIVYFPKSQIIHHHGSSGKNIATKSDQWKRLIPSSKIYHGILVHNLIFIITRIGQKFGKIVPYIILTVLIIPSFWNLMRPGFFSMQDDLQAFRVYEMDKCFDDLQFPCRWVPDAGYQYGYPQFNYYPPFPYYLGAALHRIGLQYIDSVKVLFILGYLLSAYTMYLLVKSLLKSPWVGLVTALLYTYIPYKAVEVYVRGALSEFWAQIFLPLLYWAIYKLILSGKVKYLVWMVLSIGLLVTTHTLTTMIFVPFALLWGLYWLIRTKWKNLGKIAFGGILGVGLSSFYLLPVLFERKYAHVESLLSGYFDYRQHFVSLYKLFLSREWGYGSSGFPDEKLNLSLGIVHWIIGLLAVFIAVVNLKKFKKLAILTILLFFATLFSIFMIHLRSSFIWALFPPLWFLQFPWRFLTISIFILCLLSGFFLFFTGRLKYLIGLMLIVVSFILSISFFVPKDWFSIGDKEKFSGPSWEKQLTISIFDYLPIYATLPPWQKAPELPEVLEGKVIFTNYKKGSNFQEGEIDSTGKSTIRLPLFDFPGMEVRVDGKKIVHNNDNCVNQRYCLGLISFEVPSGKHFVQAKLYDTPIRKIGNVLTLVSLGALLLLVTKYKNYEEFSKR